MKVVELPRLIALAAFVMAKSSIRARYLSLSAGIIYISLSLLLVLFTKEKGVGGARDLELRRSPNLVARFESNRLVLENFFTQERFESSPGAFELLAHMEKWRTPEQVSVEFAGYDKKSIIENVNRMFEMGLLITKDSPENQFDSRISRGSAAWPIPSRYFHFATKTSEIWITPTKVKKHYERVLRERTQPPMYKEYEHTSRVKLSRDPLEASVDFYTVLLDRKTVRDFTEQPLTFSELSNILRLTWGRVSYYKTEEFGLLLHKTSPSAGARHPTEVYPVVNNVEGVERGIYHYNVKENSLELIRKGDFRKDCDRFCSGQKWAGASCALFIMTSIVSRTTWKYRVPRTYRALLLDVGHLSQTFCLVCTAMKLGPFCTGVTSDKLVEAAIGIDGIEETILFVVGVGRPRPPASSHSDIE